MDLAQLRSFLAVAEHLHFGRAAQALGVLPASLGQKIKALEEQTETLLFQRTTRSVALTEAGAAILDEVRELLAQADQLDARLQAFGRAGAGVLRVGAIDSAAAGMMPRLLHHLRAEHPEIKVRLIEQKTVQLLPRLLNGGLDLAFCRPPDTRDPRLEFRPLFHESAVVALPKDHPLARRDAIAVIDLAEAPLIVPDRRVRPHSHDLTIRLMLEAGLTARIAQVADEKQTIVALVASGLGLAIVPRWTARLSVPGVRFVPLAVADGRPLSRLVLAAAWPRGTRDPRRTKLLATLERHLPEIEATA